MNKIIYHKPVNKRNILIFPKFKLAYINSAKCACSTIKTYLVKANNIDISNYQHIHHAHHSLKVFNHKEFNEIPKNYLRFTVVRNPYDRVVSFWSDKVRNKLWVTLNLYNINKSNIDKYYNSFEEFVKLLYQRKRFEIHLAHQITAFYVKRVDRFLRFENLKEDFKQIQKWMNYLEPLPHLRKTNHKNYREYYNETTKNMIKELYEKDLKELGYGF